MRNNLPDLCASGQVAIITASYPPIPGGTSVIMRNLLSCFNANSFTVITTRGQTSNKINPIATDNIHYVRYSVGFSYRIDSLLKKLQAELVNYRVMRAVERIRPKLIVGVYPDFYFLSASQKAAKRFGIPWVAYLHDTLTERLSGNELASRSVRLQEDVFNEASIIFVMSQGLVDLYKHKYQLACMPLEHTYLEPIPSNCPDHSFPRQAFFGGSVYGINSNSVRRISEALGQIGCSFDLASDITSRGLKLRGIAPDLVNIKFYSERRAYLNALQKQGILVLALDWPDETSINEDELSTIFPTKTPEYLASGRPILVHCPQDYFLARFFRENGCGMVVSERKVDSLVNACNYLLQDSQSLQNMQRSALLAAQKFAARRVSDLFRTELDKVAQVKWGEKIEIENTQKFKSG